MLTHQRLLELFAYDPETGLFRRLVSKRTDLVGKVAASIDEKGYVRIFVAGRRYKAHRLAWFYVTKEWPKEEIDHRDRDKGNNRFSNLREATDQEQRWNQPAYVAEGRLKGAFRQSHGKGKPWRSFITVGGSRFNLGSYDTEREAHDAYCAACIKHHGQFAAHSDNPASG